MSLTMTAHLNSSSECLVSKTCFNSVVFPAPRNPQSKEIGKRWSNASRSTLDIFRCASISNFTCACRFWAMSTWNNLWPISECRLDQMFCSIYLRKATKWVFTENFSAIASSGLVNLSFVRWNSTQFDLAKILLLQVLILNSTEFDPITFFPSCEMSSSSGIPSSPSVILSEIVYFIEFSPKIQI